MTSLLTKGQLGELGQLFKGTVVRIVIVPFLMVLGMALFLALLAGLVGAPSEIALNFLLEATGAVVVLQAKLLIAAGAIAALCFFVGAYRLDVLASYVADKLQSKMKGLALFWASMLASVRTLFPFTTAPVLRAPQWTWTVGAGIGFVSGHTPQLE